MNHFVGSVYVTISTYLQSLSSEVAVRVQAGAAQTGFQVTNFLRPVMILVGLGMFVRIIVVLALVNLDRKNNLKNA
jgi:hypothetical protein